MVSSPQTLETHPTMYSSNTHTHTHCTHYTHLLMRLKVICCLVCGDAVVNPEAVVTHSHWFIVSQVIQTDTVFRTLVAIYATAVPIYMYI